MATQHEPTQCPSVASLLSRLGSREYRCYHCGEVFAGSARAMSASCPNCFKQVTTQDTTVKVLHWGGALQSCGEITISRKARVIGKVVIASRRVRVLGSLESLVVCGGPVLIGRGATLKGGVIAPSVEIECGAEVEGGPFMTRVDPIGKVDAAKLLSVANRPRNVRELAAYIRSEIDSESLAVLTA